MKSKVTARTIGEYVHKQAMERMEQGDGGYWECVHMTLDADPDLKSLYAGVVTEVAKGPQIKPHIADGHEAGGELDRLTRAFMRQMNIDDYEWALKQVMKANPHLTKKYAQS